MCLLYVHVDREISIKRKSLKLIAKMSKLHVNACNVPKICVPISKIIVIHVLDIQVKVKVSEGYDYTIFIPVQPLSW